MISFIKPKKLKNNKDKHIILFRPNWNIDLKSYLVLTAKSLYNHVTSKAPTFLKQILIKHTVNPDRDKSLSSYIFGHFFQLYGYLPITCISAYFDLMTTKQMY